MATEDDIQMKQQVCYPNSYKNDMTKDLKQFLKKRKSNLILSYIDYSYATALSLDREEPAST